jgi:tetratricopeptide (TPR) repeat protein
MTAVPTYGQAKNSTECERIWQEVMADERISSFLDKATAMEQRGVGCMDDVTFRVRLGNFYIQAKRVDRAEELVKAGLKSRPNSRELGESAAFISYLKGDLASAQTQAELLIQKYPDFAAPYLTLASIAAQKKQWEDTARYQSRAYDLAGDAKLLLPLGAALHQLGRHEDAVATIYRALKADPSLVGRSAGIDEAIYSLGSLGRFEEATQLVRRRMAADPNWQQDATFVQAAKRLKAIPQ